MRGEAHSARCDARGGEDTSVSLSRGFTVRGRNETRDSPPLSASPRQACLWPSLVVVKEWKGSSDVTHAAISTDTQVSDLHAKLSPAVLSKMREVVAGMMLLSASLDKVGSIEEIRR